VTSRCPTKFSGPNNFLEIGTRGLSASSEGSINSLALPVGNLWPNMSKSFKRLVRALKGFQCNDWSNHCRLILSKYFKLQKIFYVYHYLFLKQVNCNCSHIYKICHSFFDFPAGLNSCLLEAFYLVNDVWLKVSLGASLWTFKKLEWKLFECKWC